MDRNGLGAGGLHRLGQFYHVDAAPVPAQPAFHRDGNRDSMGHGFHNPGGQRNVLHESRAVAVTDYLGHGTAHVDVNEVTAGNLHGQGCPLGHYFGIIAKNLSSYHRTFVFPQKPGALPVPVHQGPGGYHLRYCEAGAHSGAYGSKRPVRHPGHGRQGQVAGNG